MDPTSTGASRLLFSRLQGPAEVPRSLLTLERHAAALQGPAAEDKDEKLTLEGIPGLIIVTRDTPVPARRHNVALVLVAAVDKKLRGKPMLEILARLTKYGDVHVMALNDHMLHDAPIEAWPRADVLIAIDSKGFPLQKVMEYKKLVEPAVINDLDGQLQLRDRRHMYTCLRKHNVPVAPHIIVSCDRVREGEFAPSDVVVDDHSISAGGVTLKKPFVEKPVDGDDHDVYVYFAQADGGGAQHLFRKKNGTCSAFLPGQNTLRSGSFIYEQFMPTDGFDVKVYTVGPEYFHAEGRKAPVVDGRVLRDTQGKELRCPILLTVEEKIIAKKVVFAYGQNFCGFDLLRARDGSVCCDVNGFSFVKRAPKYYEDAVQIMHSMIVKLVNPSSPNVPLSLKSGATSAIPAAQGDVVTSSPELRCVIAIARHAERTPKQKLKLVSSDPLFLALHKKYAKKPSSEVKLKDREHLLDVIERVRALVALGVPESPAVAPPSAPPIPDEADNETAHMKLKLIIQVLTAGPISGINRKVQLKPLAWDAAGDASQVLFVLKWGGEITPAGLLCAENAGVEFRNSMYPSSSGDLGGGLLRLHSTFRHDLKIYSSDEGRVQVTAAAFARGLLELDNDIPPILASLVRKDESVNKLLQDVSTAGPLLKHVKHQLHDYMQMDCSTEEILLAVTPLQSSARVEALRQLGNPRKALETMRGYLTNIAADFRTAAKANRTLERFKTLRRWDKLNKDFYNSKTDKFDISKLPDIYDSIVFDLRQCTIDDAWLAKYSDFYRLSKAFSEVIVPQEYGITPDEKLEIAQNMCRELAGKVLCDLLSSAGVEAVPAFGGGETAFQLQSQAMFDGSVLQNTERNVRSRLYFVSESHMHGMVNFLRLGPFKDMTPGPRSTTPSPSCVGGTSLGGGAGDGSGGGYVAPLTSDSPSRPLNEHFGAITELSFLSQLTARLFENRHLPLDHDDRFFVEWFLSSGQEPPSVENMLGSNGTPVLADRVLLHSGVSLKEITRAFSMPSKGSDSAAAAASPGPTPYRPCRSLAASNALMAARSASVDLGQGVHSAKWDTFLPVQPEHQHHEADEHPDSQDS